jgi:hypothetical protein
MKPIIQLALILICHCSASAQQFAFRRSQSLLVIEADTLDNPWAGGLNCGQFSTIDMDSDGNPELFVFDRTGNRIMIFENQGPVGSPKFIHQPDHEFEFPVLSDWVLLRDYNCDGEPDIFTYNGGSVAVYKNNGPSAPPGLRFSLFKNPLRSRYGNLNLPLYISRIDIPAIGDIDNDGDLDILTYDFGGSCVEFHRNMSMENFGHCDSLMLRIESDNWGQFREGGSLSDIYLNDSCDRASGGLRHAGSTLLTMDVDDDGDQDLVLGDVGSTNLALLHNGGTASYAQISSVSLNFPANHISTQAVNLPVFPAGFYVDLDRDGVRDLLVSPNSTEDFHNFIGAWRYMNGGTNTNPDFSLIEKNFLQKHMIELGEGAYPVFWDHNRDGLADLLVGNHSYWGSNSQIALYENIGSAGAPVFQLITKNYQNLAQYAYSNLIPTFGDLDGDGDDDLILGEQNGYLHYFQNIAPVAPNTPAQFILAQSQFYGIHETGNSAPAIFDLDQDGLRDLIVGNTSGKLNFYKNTGSFTIPQFSSAATISNLGQVDVTDPTVGIWGYSIPCFFQHAGKTELFVGSYRGTIYHYTDLHTAPGAIAASFLLQTQAVWNLKVGERSSATVMEITGDQYPDLILGNYSGGLIFFEGKYPNVTVETVKDHESRIKLFPVPAGEFLRFEMNSDPGLSDYTLTVADVLGGIWGIESIDHNTIRISNLPPGIYFLTLKCASGERITERFVVNH